MSFTLKDLRRKALKRYGILGDGAEDPLWTQPTMNDLANEAHRHLASETRLYWEERQANVTAGTSSIPMGSDVFEVDNDSVRCQVSGTWVPLRFVPMRQLLAEYGALDEVGQGDPWGYYLRSGSADDAHLVLKLFPTPQATVSSGLRYAAFIYPADLSAETDEPPMQEGFRDYLVPVLCWKMAELDANRGRADAPVGYWERQADDALEKLKAKLVRFRNPGPRGIRVHRYDHDGW